MKCPHCIVEINPNFEEFYLGVDVDGHWSVYAMNCPNPNCEKKIIQVAKGEAQRQPMSGSIFNLANNLSRYTVRPITSSRPPAPSEVDTMFAADYSEACLTFSFSPKASAALSRRCLQNILREKAGVKKDDLSREIQEVIDNKGLPSHLAESIDAIRVVGNFAAHPTKSTATGEIVEVEVGEAEWLLDVIEALFDFYFVQPTILKAKREALNKKLSEIGKPPMK